MAAMAMDHDHASSPAPPARLPAPPYHHSPAAAAVGAEEEVATPPRKSAAAAGAQRSSPMPSPLQLSGCSLQELLLMSPPPGSARRNRSRQRGAGLDESLEMVAAAGTPPRRRRRVGGEQCAAPAVASPRNGRRARRRLEKEIEVEDDAARRARRRKSTRAAATKAAPAAADKVAVAAAADKEDTSMALVLASTDAIRGADALEQSGWEDLWERIVDLVMWKNVAKSTLWFGLGSMFFFSCSFSREITFSPISALCHMGVMVLGLAFFKDSIPQSRQQLERGRSFRLTEDDVLRAARAVLPVANSMISTAQVIFSGEPSMTLKVLPALLFGAKYGSLVTVWRLLATVENLTDRALEAWKSCPRKKLVVGTAVTMCWNLFSVKTRIIAAFISVVILRYNQKYRKAVVDAGVESCQDEQEQKMEIED
uniref:Reticulon domain-containing protein n=1 Tax=Oryza punctata TaxID=4537 RepID=A0A0E0JYU3_ORYPU